MKVVFIAGTKAGDKIELEKPPDIYRVPIPPGSWQIGGNSINTPLNPPSIPYETYKLMWMFNGTDLSGFYVPDYVQRPGRLVFDELVETYCRSRQQSKGVDS